MRYIGIIEPVVLGICRGKQNILLISFVRFDEALFDFDRAISLESTNPIIYSNRGLVNRKLENFEAAIQDYTNEL
jgi:tetratricopeptide (TPR) repeat protein